MTYKQWINEMERRCWVALASGCWVHDFDMQGSSGYPLFITEYEAAHYLVSKTFPVSSKQRKIAKLVMGKWVNYEVMEND